MALDVVGLMDAIGIEKAHIFGMSMGGMIAQILAINHPEKIITMTNLMSTANYQILQELKKSLFSIIVERNMWKMLLMKIKFGVI